MTVIEKRPSLIFEGKVGAYHSGGPVELHSKRIKSWLYVTYSEKHPSLMFTGKAGGYPSGGPVELFSKGSLFTIG
jgi:hypothetical protein